LRPLGGAPLAQIVPTASRSPATPLSWQYAPSGHRLEVCQRAERLRVNEVHAGPVVSQLRRAPELRARASDILVRPSRARQSLVDLWPTLALALVPAQSGKGGPMARPGAARRLRAGRQSRAAEPGWARGSTALMLETAAGLAVLPLTASTRGRVSNRARCLNWASSSPSVVAAGGGALPPAVST